MDLRRLSQRKSIQRLGGTAAVAALFSAIGVAASGELTIGRVNTDGFSGAVSGYTLTNTGGITVPVNTPTVVVMSPDSNWLIMAWASGATPGTQLYKRSGAKTWAYYGALPSAPTSVLNSYCINFNFVFNATSDKLYYVGSGASNQNILPVYWTLSSNVWTYQGTLSNMTGGFGYAESNDGLLRLQVDGGGTNVRGNYNGTGLTIGNGLSAPSDSRLYVSPTGAYVAQMTQSEGVGRLCQFQRSGTSLSLLRVTSLPVSSSGSAGFWLSEGVIVFGSRPLSGNSGSTLASNIYMADIVNNTLSTLTFDTVVYYSGMPDSSFDAVTDVFLVSAGVIGYVTAKGIIGTANFTGTTFTGLGSGAGLKPPKFSGASIIRVP